MYLLISFFQVASAHLTKRGQNVHRGSSNCQSCYELQKRRCRLLPRREYLTGRSYSNFNTRGTPHFMP